MTLPTPVELSKHAEVRQICDRVGQKLHLQPSDVEDLSQQVKITILQVADSQQWQDEMHFLRWVATTARYSAYHIIRKNNRFPQLPETSQDAILDTADQMPEFLTSNESPDDRLDKLRALNDKRRNEAVGEGVRNLNLEAAEVTYVGKVTNTDPITYLQQPLSAAAQRKRLQRVREALLLIVLGLLTVLVQFARNRASHDSWVHGSPPRQIDKPTDLAGHGSPARPSNVTRLASHGSPARTGNKDLQGFAHGSPPRPTNKQEFASHGSPARKIDKQSIA